MEHIIVSPFFGSSLGSVIGSLQTLSWSAYSAGPHTARILLIPDIARYKWSTTVLNNPDKYKILNTCLSVRARTTHLIFSFAATLVALCGVIGYIMVVWGLSSYTYVKF